jgi:hypothetical protein
MKMTTITIMRTTTARIGMKMTIMKTVTGLLPGTRMRTKTKTMITMIATTRKMTIRTAGECTAGMKKMRVVKEAVIIGEMRVIITGRPQTGIMIAGLRETVQKITAAAPEEMTVQAHRVQIQDKVEGIPEVSDAIAKVIL